MYAFISSAAVRPHRSPLSNFNCARSPLAPVDAATRKPKRRQRSLNLRATASPDGDGSNGGDAMPQFRTVLNSLRTATPPPWADLAFHVAITALAALHSLQAQKVLLAFILSLTSSPSLVQLTRTLSPSTSDIDPHGDSDSIYVPHSASTASAQPVLTPDMLSELEGKLTARLQSLSSDLADRDTVLAESLSAVQARLDYPPPPPPPPPEQERASFSDAAELRALRARLARLEAVHAELHARLAAAEAGRAEAEHDALLSGSELRAARAAQRALRESLAVAQARADRADRLEALLRDADDEASRRDDETSRLDDVLRSLGVRRRDRRDRDDNARRNLDRERDEEDDSEDDAAFWKKALQKKVDRLLPNSIVADELKQVAPQSPWPAASAITAPQPSRVDGMPDDGGFAGGAQLPVPEPDPAPQPVPDSPTTAAPFSFSRDEFTGQGLTTSVPPATSLPPDVVETPPNEKGQEQEQEQEQQSSDADTDSSTEASEVGVDGEQSEAETESVQQLVARGRDLVRRGRQRGLSAMEAGEHMGAGVAQLERALELASSDDDQKGEEEGEAWVGGELGAALVAWAKVDVSATGAPDKLLRADALLAQRTATAPADTAALFSLGLCRSLRAAMTGDAALYRAAVRAFDDLLAVDPRSRIACFNCGLSCVSLARIAAAPQPQEQEREQEQEQDQEQEQAKEEDKIEEKAEEKVETDVKAEADVDIEAKSDAEADDAGAESEGETQEFWLRKALGHFERALELKPHDAKATAYADDCRRQLDILAQQPLAG